MAELHRSPVQGCQSPTPGDPRAFKHFFYLVHLIAHYTCQHMPCLVALSTVHMYGTTASFKDLTTIAQENATKQIADVLIETVELSAGSSVLLINST